MNKYVRLGSVLLIITAVAGIVLAFVNSKTADIIAQQELEATLAAYEEIFGDTADSFEPMDEGKMAKINEQYPFVTDMFIASKDGQQVGYGINFTSSGYGGKLNNAVGLFNDKTIAGFRNIQNSETPGIGTRIEEPEYYEGFAGKDFSGGEVTGSPTPASDTEVPLITGASVSSGGILRALNDVLSNFDGIVAE